MPFWSRDLYLHVILHFRSKFRINRPIHRQDIAKNDFQYGVRTPSWICKLSIFVKSLRNGNLHMHTKFDRNWIIDGWDMEIKLFSKWRPSAILNFRKLPFGHVMRVILHLRSKFRINRPIWRRDIAKNDFQFGMSAILDLLWRLHITSKNLILCSQLCVKFSRRSVALFVEMPCSSCFSILAWNCLFRV